jgi:hypothetical protein
MGDKLRVDAKQLKVKGSMWITWGIIYLELRNSNPFDKLRVKPVRFHSGFVLSEAKDKISALISINQHKSA